MSEFEKKIGENMVDDMLPPEPKPKGVDRSKYGNDFWDNGGDNIDDFTGKTGGGGTFFDRLKREDEAYAKVKKPFSPTVPHPSKPSYKREEYEGSGGWARAKLRNVSAAHPLISMGQTLQIETVLLETIATVLKDEVFDLLEESDVAAQPAAGKELLTFLRQWILDHHVGWDKMVKKYKPIEEEK